MSQSEGKNGVSRREFLVTSATGVVALGALGMGGLGLIKEPSKINRDADGVIFPEPSLCIGCLSCEVACQDVHKKAGLPDVPRIRIFNEPATKLDPELIRVNFARGNFFQHVCLQCPDAPCVPVCPVNALHIEPKTGARVIDPQVCIACGRCETSCPFEVRSEEALASKEPNGQRTRITYDPASNAYTKCDLCYFRPEGPACIERCPINVRIKQGVIKSERMCLGFPKADAVNFAKLRDQQTVKKSAG